MRKKEVKLEYFKLPAIVQIGNKLKFSGELKVDLKFRPYIVEVTPGHICSEHVPLCLNLGDPVSVSCIGYGLGYEPTQIQAWFDDRKLRLQQYSLSYGRGTSLEGSLELLATVI